MAFDINNIETNDEYSDNDHMDASGDYDPNSDYGRVSFEDFQKHLDQDVRQAEPSHEVVNEPENGGNLFDQQNKQSLETIERNNKFAAKTIVKVGDEVIARTLAYSVAQNGEVKRYQATKDDLKDLEAAVIEVMPKDKPLLSPKSNLGLTILRIYGSKLDDAFRDKKEAEEIKRLKKIDEENKRKIAELEYEIKVQRMTKDYIEAENALKKVKHEATNDVQPS